jgi:hypothetical protein
MTKKSSIKMANAQPLNETVSIATLITGNIRISSSNLTRITEVVHDTIALLNRRIPSDHYICAWSDIPDVRTTVHAILRIFACITDDDRFIRCYPGKGAQPCRGGITCPFMIAQCMYQWDASYQGILTKDEIKKGLTGCNFLHSIDDMNAVRDVVWQYLEKFYRTENFIVYYAGSEVDKVKTGYLHTALLNVNHFYQANLRSTNPQTRLTPCYSCKNGTMEWRQICSVRDEIFLMPDKEAELFNARPVDTVSKSVIKSSASNNDDDEAMEVIADDE